MYNTMSIYDFLERVIRFMSKNKIKSIYVIMAICMNISASSSLAADLSIDEAVDMALTRNNDVKIANEEKMVAEANYQAARGVNGFSISLGSSLSASDGVHDGIDADFQKGNSNNISATMPLYTGNKNELTIDNKAVELHKAELNLGRVQETVKYDTIKAYYDILEAEQNVNIEQESVSNYESHLSDVRNLYAAGSIPKSDVLRSEVALSDAQQSLIMAQNQYEINLSIFRNIIKINRNEDVNLTDDFAYRMVKMSLPECLDYAFFSRKDMQTSKLDVEIAKNNIDIAKAGYLPTVNFALTTSWDKQVLPSSDDHDYQVGVSANWNIFDNNVTKSNVKSAEASYNKAEYMLFDMEDTIDLEVRQAYLNMREAERRFNSTAMAVKQAEEDYFIASEKYKVGAGIILDVIDAELALSQARLNYTSAQYDYARYRANLEYVIGTPKEETIDG